jgi:hypothetical protein
MLSLTRQMFAAAILLAIVSTFSTVRVQAQAEKKERSGSVSGRVTINGKGASGVVVTLIRYEVRSRPGDRLRSLTDQEGNYRIAGVPAGKYQVTPLAPALVPKNYDQAPFISMGKSLLMGEGETVEGIDFALIRGGVITGKITDAGGQPIIEELVSIERADQGNRSDSWNPLSWMAQQTDDRGIFRIFGIPPGRYRVVAGPNEDGSYQRTTTGRTTYKRTFHPNVTYPAKATIIEISEGAEATGVDITVGAAIPGFAVSGRILHSETERPIANASLYLIHTIVVNDNHSNRDISSVPRSNSQGEFRVENLVPGTYALATWTDSDLRISPVKFEIVDQDVSGLVVRATPAASVAGKVVIENPGNEADKTNLAQLYIDADVSGEVNDFDLGRTMSLKPDGGFRFAGLPAGTVQFSVGAFSRSDSGYQISRIERDGLVQPNGIQIQDGEQVTGVRVVIVGGNATIRGVIKVENGPLPAGANLHVQIMKTGERSSRMRHPDMDSRGNFMIDRLAPGTYELTAMAFLPSSQSSQVLGSSTKQVVNVADGGVTEVTLKIDLKQNTKP